MKCNYRKLYENKEGKIQNNTEEHHIDVNHDNNNIKNLNLKP